MTGTNCFNVYIFLNFQYGEANISEMIDIDKIVYYNF